MATKSSQEDLVHEYPSIGKYRLRILKRGDGPAFADCREWVQSETFEGFTRRGIRLTSAEQVNSLRDALADAIARGWFDE